MYVEVDGVDAGVIWLREYVKLSLSFSGCWLEAAGRPLDLMC
jgi:hypothetical protein